MSKKYQNELKNVAKDSGIAGVGFIILFFLNYFISIVITRTLGPQLYGIFSIGLSILTFINSISLLGLNQGTIKFISQYQTQNKPEYLKGTINYVLKVVCITSIVFSVLLILCRDVIANFFDKPQLAETLFTFGLYLPIMNMVSIFVSIFRGFERTNFTVLCTNIIFPVVRLASIYLFLIILKMQINGTIFTFIISNFIVLVVFLFGYYKNIYPVFSTKSPKYETKKLFNFSIPLYLEMFINDGINQLPIFFVGYYLISKDAGIYALSVKLSYMLIIALRSYNLVIAPKISRIHTMEDKILLQKFYKSGTKWIIVVSLALFCMFSIYSKEILKIFGDEFVDGNITLLIILLGELINVSSGPVGFMLIMTNKSKVVLVNSIFMLVITVLLCIWFVPHYGIIGAGIARALSVGIVNIIRLVEVYYFERIYPYNWHSIKPFIAAIISSIITYYLIKTNINFHYILNIILGSIIFCIIYVLQLFVYGFEEDEKVILQSAVIKFKSLLK